MRRLTELDLQNALDECELMRFLTHGDWLAGMVKRLNSALILKDDTELTEKAIPTKMVVTTINAADPGCIS